MTAILRPILNREGKLPEQGWVPIIAKGEVPIDLPDGKGGVVTVTQVYDDASIDAIMNSFQKDASRPGFAGMLIDFDHFSQDLDKPSEAAGWGMEFRKVDDGLEARSQFSDMGLSAVNGLRYKFASVVHQPEDMQVIGKNRVRPVRVDTIALTNDPRNKRLRPFDINTLMNRAGAVPSAEDKNDPGQPGKQKGTQDVDYKLHLLKILGLPETATDQEIQAAIDAASGETMKNRGDRITALTNELIEIDLETHKGVIKNRDNTKKALARDRTGTLELLQSLHTGGGAALNRGDGKNPKIDLVTEEGEVDAATSQKIANRAGELLATKAARNRRSAFEMARSEVLGAKK